MIISLAAVCHIVCMHVGAKTVGHRVPPLGTGVADH